MTGRILSWIESMTITGQWANEGDRPVSSHQLAMQIIVFEEIYDSTGHMIDYADID